MSVNRNILKNSATPLGGDVTPPEVNLVTTSGSRWVILDFLNVNPTASNGSCTGVTLEWSPDPSMVTNPFQPSSSYYSVTSSQFSCASASLSPLTGSVAWSQFIDSYWLKTPMTPAGIPTEYYLRAYQTRNTSPVTIYSPAVAVQTRAEAYCGEIYTSSLVIPYILADMDGYNSPGFSGKWMNDIGDALGPNESASFAGGVTIANVKAGGPNYDGLRVDEGGRFSWPQVTITSTDPIRSGVGIVRGTAQWTARSNGLDFLINVDGTSTPTTSSITITRVDTGAVVGKIESGLVPTSLANTYVEIILDKNNSNTSEIRVDNNNVGTFNLGAAGAGGSIILKDNFQMSFLGTNPIVRCVTAQMPYNPTVFHCKYGPVGASSYTP